MLTNLKEFDIDLTLKEAEEISKATDKLLSVTAGKLEDELVSNVVGGINPTEAAVLAQILV